MSGRKFPFTLALKFPVELRNADGQVVDTLTSLVFNRPKGKDVREAFDAMDPTKGKGNGAMVHMLMVRSTSQPPSTLDQLDASDYAAAAEIVGDFVGGSLPTG